MTWNQILGKMRQESVLADIRSSVDILEQVATSVGSHDEASFELVSCVNFPLKTEEKAEEAMRNMIRVTRDFHKFYVHHCDKKGEHKAIVSLLASDRGCLCNCIVEVTREC